MLPGNTPRDMNTSPRYPCWKVSLLEKVPFEVKRAIFGSVTAGIAIQKDVNSLIYRAPWALFMGIIKLRFFPLTNENRVLPVPIVKVKKF